MSEQGGGQVGVHHRFRAMAERVVARVGGVPAVRTLLTTLAVYDRAGGGLMAGGLAYAALVALLPGLLLVLSVIGMLVDDPAVREDIVKLIGTAVPPLEELVRIALDAVSTGAVPTGILAFLGLLWGSSRFYAALDYAFARIFLNAPQRNEIVRTFRGLVVTVLFVVVPIAAVILSSAVTWLLDLAPDGATLGTLERLFWRVASPLGSVVLFVGATAVVYRFVPGRRVPSRAYLLPAVLVGLALAAFTQLFALIAPLMFRVTAVYGTIVAAFVLLAWLSIAFNALLFGGSWTWVRAAAIARPDGAPVDPATTDPAQGSAG
jgi:membrane protein